MFSCKHENSPPDRVLLTASVPVHVPTAGQPGDTNQIGGAAAPPIPPYKIFGANPATFYLAITIREFQMPEEIYELIAQGARYWFLFLMVLIVWRSWRWYRKDKKQAKKRLKLLPDAGFVGEMVVLQGGGPLAQGTALPIPREGTLGFSRTNDLCVPVFGVSKKHLWFRYDDAKGLLVEPFHHNMVSVDGEEFKSRRDPLYMAHGSRLQVGEAVLRLRLFAGFESIGHAARPAEPMMEPAQPDAPQPDQAQMAQQQAAYQQWLQQQWAMQEYARQQAYQQGYQQAMAQQAIPEEMEEPDETEDGMADVYSYEEARARGLVDHSAFMRPEGERRPELPVYESDVPAQPAQEEFFPPVMDEEEDWAYDLQASDDEDMTDAAAPPRSAYVGRDEAEKAKRQLWDRYFGGGPR